MGNVIVFMILAVILGSAIAYIVKAKKSGVKCIGCSAGGCACGSMEDGSTGCSGGCSGCRNASE